MKKESFIIVAILTTLIGSFYPLSISAQSWGAGLKILPLELFLFYKLEEAIGVEAGFVLIPMYTGTILGGGLGLSLIGKLYLDEVIIAKVSLKPFLGAGTYITPLSGWQGYVTGLQGLGGAEYTVPDTRFKVFGEIALSVASISNILVGGLGFNLGGRLDF